MKDSRLPQSRERIEFRGNGSKRSMPSCGNWAALSARMSRKDLIGREADFGRLLSLACSPSSRTWKPEQSLGLRWSITNRQGVSSCVRSAGARQKEGTSPPIERRRDGQLVTTDEGYLPACYSRNDQQTVVVDTSKVPLSALETDLEGKQAFVFMGIQFAGDLLDMSYAGEPARWPFTNKAGRTADRVRVGDLVIFYTQHGFANFVGVAIVDTAHSWHRCRQEQKTLRVLFSGLLCLLSSPSLWRRVAQQTGIHERANRRHFGPIGIMEISHRDFLTILQEAEALDYAANLRPGRDTDMPSLEKKNQFDVPPEVEVASSEAQPSQQAPEPPLPISTAEGAASTPTGRQPPVQARTPSAIPEGRMQAKTLFSRHYLETRLPDHPEWAERPGRPSTPCAPCGQSPRYGDNWNEAQTEDEFVKPVLEALGWSYIVQPKVAARRRRSPGPTMPSLRRSDQGRRPIRYQGHDDPFYSRALAIAEAKYWGRPLSQKDASGRNTWKTGSNPSHQMVSYLVGTAVPWGILTNGRDLAALQPRGQQHRQRVLRGGSGPLFDFLPAERRAAAPGATGRSSAAGGSSSAATAFMPDAQGRSFVQRVHEGSATYAREISDKLKELVFERGDAGDRRRLRRLSPPRSWASREETRGEPARDLPGQPEPALQAALPALRRGAQPAADGQPGLPRGEPDAHGRSGRPSGIDKSADPQRRHPRHAASTTACWRSSTASTRATPAWACPRYNGGLFNPATPENQFLEAAQAQRPGRGPRRGHCWCATPASRWTTPTSACATWARSTRGCWRTSCACVDAASRPQVELVNDKGERKATGSYYTPDYIVEYIVEHTLDPILDERAGQLRGGHGPLRRAAPPAAAHRRTRAPTGLLRGQLDEAERDAPRGLPGHQGLRPGHGLGPFPGQRRGPPDRRHHPAHAGLPRRATRTCPGTGTPSSG